jgi:hypothetical protein
MIVIRNDNAETQPRFRTCERESTYLPQRGRCPEGFLSLRQGRESLAQDVSPAASVCSIAAMSCSAVKGFAKAMGAPSAAMVARFSSNTPA